MLEGKIKIPLHLIAERSEFLRAADVGGNLRGKFSAVIMREQVGSQAGLLEIVDALRLLGARLGLADGGQQQRCENADDRNDDQHFDQSECSPVATDVRRVHAVANL